MRGYIIISNNYLAESITYFTQCVFLCLKLTAIVNLRDRLNVITPIAQICNEINGQIVSDLTAVRIRFVCGNYPCVNREMSAAKFVIDCIFHKLSHVKVLEF